MGQFFVSPRLFFNERNFNEPHAVYLNSHLRILYNNWLQTVKKRLATKIDFLYETDPDESKNGEFFKKKLVKRIHNFQNYFVDRVGEEVACAQYSKVSEMAPKFSLIKLSVVDDGFILLRDC